MDLKLNLAPLKSGLIPVVYGGPSYFDVVSRMRKDKVKPLDVEDILRLRLETKDDSNLVKENIWYNDFYSLTAIAYDLKAKRLKIVKSCEYLRKVRDDSAINGTLSIRKRTYDNLKGKEFSNKMISNSVFAFGKEEINISKLKNDPILQEIIEKELLNEYFNHFQNSITRIFTRYYTDYFGDYFDTSFLVDSYFLHSIKLGGIYKDKILDLNDGGIPDRLSSEDPQMIGLKDQYKLGGLK